jgi:hypothetical protein
MHIPLMSARRSRLPVIASCLMALLACAPTLGEQKAQILANKITFDGLTMEAFLDTWGKPTYQYRELTVFYLMDDGNRIPRFRVPVGEPPAGWSTGAMAAEAVFFGYADRGELLGFVDGRLVYRQHVPAEEVHAAGKMWAHEQRFKTPLESPAPAAPATPAR